MKTYRGLRSKGEAEVIVSDDGREPIRFEPGTSILLVNHSPTGFNWGYCGSGAAQLALALLLDVGLEAEFATMLYQDFKAKVVAGLGDQWTLKETDICLWVCHEVLRRYREARGEDV